MADEEVPPPTELELKIASIELEYGAACKPIELRKGIWSGELELSDGIFETASVPLKSQRDTAVEAASQVVALQGLSLVDAKSRARCSVILANLEDLDRQLHVLALDQVRRNDAPRFGTLRLPRTSRQFMYAPQSSARATSMPPKAADGLP
ncbi:hypothetical protein T492DRAFT_918393 [Pavlovales sp. CCMP2436]|nr:hypothetical protein T492DRAFT_918393 [Pavlovales sp. CCMP2436]